MITLTSIHPHFPSHTHMHSQGKGPDKSRKNPQQGFSHKEKEIERESPSKLMCIKKLEPFVTAISSNKLSCLMYSQP